MRTQQSPPKLTVTHSQECPELASFPVTRFEGTQLVVISNTLWVGEQLPCLTYGMRGMISLSIEARSWPA